jgi:hypothetical protein
VLAWAGAGVGVLALLLFDLSWLGLFLLVILIAAYEVAIYRVLAPDVPDAEVS